MGKVLAVQAKDWSSIPNTYPPKHIHMLLTPVLGGGDRQILGLAGWSSHPELLVPVRDPISVHGNRRNSTQGWLLASGCLYLSGPEHIQTYIPSTLLPH